MAENGDVVRITYRELEEIARKKASNAQGGHYRYSKEDLKTSAKDVEKQRERKSKASKRPTRGIYQPPILSRVRQNRDQGIEDDGGAVIPETENWEEDELFIQSPPDSKESSIEREIDTVATDLKDVKLGGGQNEAHRDRNNSQSEARRRPKRPAIQIYVPKGKILEQAQQAGEEVDIDEEIPEQEETISPGRKIDLKSDQKHIQVTVVNDHAAQTRPKPIGGEAEKEDSTPKKIPCELRDVKPPRFEGRRPDWSKQTRANKAGDNTGPKSPIAGSGISNDTSWKSMKAESMNDLDTGWETPILDAIHAHGAGRPPKTERQSSFEKTGWKSPQLDRRNNREAVWKSPQVDRRNPRETGWKSAKYWGSLDRHKKSPRLSDELFDDESSGPITTMVFERRTESVSSEGPDGIQKGKNAKSLEESKSKRYSMSSRRPRTGSVSSDISTTSDVSIEEEDPPRILDWDLEVEREMARQVQDETQKLHEWLKQQDQVEPSNPPRSDETGRQRNNSGYRDGTYTEDRKGRKKERRRRGSLDVRSRESSAHSVQSYHGDEDMYGSDLSLSGGRSGRRRRRRSRNSSLQKSLSRESLESEFSDPRKMNLKVTLASNERRQVHVQEMDTGRDQGRDNRDHRDMGKGRGRGKNGANRDQQGGGFRKKSGKDGTSSEPASSPKGGGLIRLPTHTDQPQEPRRAQNDQRRGNQPHYQQGSGQKGQSQREKIRSHGRDGRSQKSLFDPNNPNKPIVVSNNSSNLQFQETFEQPQQFPSPEQYHMGYGPYYPDYGYGYSDGRYVNSPQPGVYYGYPNQYKDSGLFQDDTYTRDPYYHSDNDPDHMIGGRPRAQCRVMAEQIFRDALPFDNQLGNLVARRISGDEGVRMIIQLRQELQSKYEQVIFLDPDLANKHQVEHLLWKSVYYQVIEVLRKQLNEDKEKKTKEQLFMVLDQGTSFYEKLLEKLQATFGFSLEMFLDANTLPPDNLSRTVKLALLSAQRTMICLGDIARYREQANDSGKVNYGKARSWYTKAQQIAPKNGRPYNQLAILALYTRHKLDAVYYYMRSLAASNPFLTARESLMSVFEETRKKADSVEQKRHAEKIKLQKLKQRRYRHGHRIEVWIAADGTSSQDNLDDNYEEDLSKLDAVELNKRFVLSFLNVHGKLFTKIGMEMFAESCAQMLQEFQALLKDGAIGPTRLLQLMAINMFAIENTALKDETLENTCRSLLQEHAVQLGLDMFGILVDKCSDQLMEHMKSRDYPAHMFSVELEELIPGVKSWTDWMVCHSNLWNPPPAVRDTRIGPNIDVWKITSKLSNILKDIDVSHVKLYHDKREGCDPVILFEDALLSGFIPLLSAPTDPMFVHTTVEKEIAKDCLRIQKLQLFGEYLCGIEPPMLAYNVETREYYSVAPPISLAENEEQNPSDLDSSAEEDVIVESEEEEVFMEEEGHVSHLKARKEELKKKVKEQTKHQENVQKILDKNRHRCIELEIHPIFLVPDTNCFIEHITDMKKLIEAKKFTVVVPLVVINELDGLSRGSRQGQHDSIEHVREVAKKASETVTFLEKQFEMKNSHLKALTSKGNVMETIGFRSEETDRSGNNDDLILSCCLHYCQDKARDFMPKEKDAPVCLYREVVMLTDDRNLRLKAHTCNVPVKDAKSFIKWSKIT